jgi:hypothetical protein
VKAFQDTCWPGHPKSRQLFKTFRIEEVPRTLPHAWISPGPSWSSGNACRLPEALRRNICGFKKQELQESPVVLLAPARTSRVRKETNLPWKNIEFQKSSTFAGAQENREGPQCGLDTRNGGRHHNVLWDSPLYSAHGRSILLADTEHYETENWTKYRTYYVTVCSSSPEVVAHKVGKVGVARGDDQR